jgi:hypothetical protein
MVYGELKPTPCLSLYLRHVLSDEEARRIEDQAAAADRGTLLRWVGELLGRKERSALLQRLARQLAYARRRLREASNYLGLLQRAEGTSRAPWPGKLPCPHCGAPAVLVRAELRSEGHVVVHDHPDGVHCERPPARGRRGP